MSAWLFAGFMCALAVWLARRSRAYAKAQRAMLRGGWAR